MTEVQELVARLRLKDEMSGPIRKVRAGISGVSDALNSPRMQKGISQIGTGIKNAALIGAVGIAALASQVALGLKSLIELEQQEAQTAAVIKSTGGIAGITAIEVGKLSEKYEALNAIIGDEVIREAQNMLLTFTNVREDAFEPALEAILDMNTALGKGPEGLQSTAIAVGKALNDPVGGLVALKKAGVNLDDGQKALIKSLVETGDVLGAQKIILAELDKEFGGSFLAQGGKTAGKVASFTDAIEDLQRVLATALLPVVGKVATELQKLLASDDFINGAKDIGNAIAGLFSDQNIATGAGLLKEVFAVAKTAAPVILEAAKATVAIVGSAVSLFRSLPPEIQQLAIGAFAINKLTGGLVTNIAGGLISGVLKQLVSGVVNVRGASVIVTGAAGGGGVAGAAGKGGSTLGKVAGAAAKVFLVGAAVGVFAELKGALDEQGAANRAGIAGQSQQAAVFIKSATLDEMKSSLEGLVALDKDLNDGLTPEKIAYQVNMDGVRTALEARIRELKAEVARQTLQQTASGRTLVSTADAIKRFTGTFFNKDKPGQVGNPATRGTTGGRNTGGVTSLAPEDRKALHDISRFTHEQLAAFRDNKINKADLAAIPKLLTFYQTSLAPSQKSMQTDIAQLTAIQAHYAATGDTATATYVGAQIQALKLVADNAARVTAAGDAKVVAATTGVKVATATAASVAARASEAAGNAVSATVRAKNLSVTTVNQNTVNVSYRDTVRVTQTHHSIYKGATPV